MKKRLLLVVPSRMVLRKKSKKSFFQKFGISNFGGSGEWRGHRSSLSKWDDRPNSFFETRKNDFPQTEWWPRNYKKTRLRGIWKWLGKTTFPKQNDTCKKVVLSVLKIRWKNDFCSYQAEWYSVTSRKSRFPQKFGIPNLDGSGERSEASAQSLKMRWPPQLIFWDPEKRLSPSRMMAQKLQKNKI